MGAAGVYLHLPFCSAICPYCDFSVVTGGESRRRRFVDLLVQEMEMVAPEAADRRFDTVYLGGGTPSIVPLVDLERLIEAIRCWFTLLSPSRFFLEANPEDVNPRSLAGWRSLGFETLSLGVQSFNDASLLYLGRRHSGADAKRAVTEALRTGLGTVSLDLIFGIPGQSLEDWRRDLRTAIELGPDHISCYQLTVHQGTPFGARRDRGELVEVGNNAQAEFLFSTHRVLGEAGYQAYEVSNFARGDRHRSSHNQKYWDHTPYVGLGPSAHSFEGRRRWWNLRSLGAWQEALRKGVSPIGGREDLTVEQLVLERIMLGLRTPEGVDLGVLGDRYGVDLAGRNRQLVERLEQQKLLTRSETRLLPTLEGLSVADGLSASFRL